MITLQYSDEPFLLAWAAAHLGTLSRKIAWGNHAHAIGVLRDGQLCAVCVFDRFTGASAEISFVSDGSKRWMDRNGLRKVLAYPFVQLGLKRISAFIGASNAPAIRTAIFLGFEETPEAVLRDALPDGDMLIFRMFAADCPWLKPDAQNSRPPCS